MDSIDLRERDSTGRVLQARVGLHLGPAYVLRGTEPPLPLGARGVPLSEEGVNRAVEQYVALVRPREDHGINTLLAFRDETEATLRFTDGGSEVRPLIEIENRGSSTVRIGVLQQLLGIRVGDTLTRQKIHRAVLGLSRYEFLRNSREEEIEFTPEGIRLILYIAPRRASYGQGGFAFAPEGGASGFTWSADVDFQLTNIMRNAERMAFAWHARGGDNQHFSLAAEYPVLWASRWGLMGSMDLRKESGGRRLFSGTGGILLAITPAQSFALLGGYREGAQDGAMAEGPQQSIAIQEFSFGYRLNLQQYTGVWPNGLRGEASVSMGRREVDTLSASSRLGYNLRSEYDRPYSTWGYVRVAFRSEGVFAMGHSTRLVALEWMRLGGNTGLLGCLDNAVESPWYALLHLEPGVQVGEWLRLSLQGLIAPIKWADGTLLMGGAGCGADFRTDVGVLRLTLAKAWDNRGGGDSRRLMLHLGLRFVF